MKKNFTRTLILSVLLFMITFWVPVLGQEPPHPPQSGHGMQGNQPPGGGAKIGDGVSILVAFAIAYGYRRIRQRKKQNVLIDDKKQ